MEQLEEGCVPFPAPQWIVGLEPKLNTIISIIFHLFFIRVVGASPGTSRHRNRRQNTENKGN
jgi:hypothetical protein